MSQTIEGFFLDKDGVRHRMHGESNHENWSNPHAPTVNWYSMSDCRLARTGEGTALSSAVRPVTCILCIAEE